MNIIFTICSNNYLAQAKTLGDSIKLTNPEYLFFIGLTDILSPEIDYPNEIEHEIILCNEIGIPDFDNLWKKYSIIEFCTCVKPFYFQYFINNFADLEYLYYLDPDTFVYGNLNIIEKEFGMDGRILLTPHIVTPINLDNKMPTESLFLTHGIYNLGFLGFKNPENKNELLDWWSERTYNLGYNQPWNGLFVDQLWFNLAPLFFNDIIISKNPGLNMAPWNLHERHLSQINGINMVNDDFILIFYHFSNYKHNDSNNLAGISYDRYNFVTKKDLKSIYKNYHKHLLLNGIKKIESVNCHYMKMKDNYLYYERKKEIKSSYKKLLKYYLKRMLPSKALEIINILK